MQNNSRGAARSALIVWRCWRVHQLSQALKDCQNWEEDAQRHGIGYATLSYDAQHRQWRVLVSPDLMAKEVPF